MSLTKNDYTGIWIKSLEEEKCKRVSVNEIKNDDNQKRRKKVYQGKLLMQHHTMTIILTNIFKRNQKYTLGILDLSKPFDT